MPSVEDRSNYGAWGRAAAVLAASTWPPRPSKTYTAPVPESSPAAHVSGSGENRITSNEANGAPGAAVKLIGKKGCLTYEGPRDQGVAGWRFPARKPCALVGQPRIAPDAAVTGEDAKPDVRIWDRSPDGSAALVSRGTYRHDGPGGRPTRVRCLAGANAGQFRKGPAGRVEVTGDPVLPPPQPAVHGRDRLHKSHASEGPVIRRPA